MGFIPCTSNCKYQQDGTCLLEQASSIGTVSNSGCIHYVPKEVSEYSLKKIKKEDANLTMHSLKTNKNTH